jgi:hypothetical protein
MLTFIISWIAFSITFGLTLLFSFIMAVQSVHFYTYDGVEKKFSMMELEIPASNKELVNIIGGIYKLTDAEKKSKAITALKSQLYIDFLFMPCAYGSIFILCMLVSSKMQYSIGFDIFWVMAYLQIIPWICDIIENIYLLGKIKKRPHLSTISVHKAYIRMEYLKWTIALGSGICAVAAICYFWLAGKYAVHSLNYLAIIAGEVIVFALVAKLFLKKKAVLAS